jgi:hypothetical protein
MTFQKFASYVFRDGALFSVVLFVAVGAVQRTYSCQLLTRASIDFVSSGQRILRPSLRIVTSQPNARGLVPVPDTVLDPTLAWTDGRKIPRVVYVTSRSVHDKRVCRKHRQMAPQPIPRPMMTPWLSYSIVTGQNFPTQKVQPVYNFRGAVKADIWRILVLYEYGGIYGH